MSKLKELEKRLRDEPENLGLRVMLAGALHDAGRLGDAVELYRSVAIAYREQGRLLQAITVCRSVLEIAPDDASCQALLATMIAHQPAPLDSPPSGQSPALPPGPTPPWFPPPPSTDPEDGDSAAPARRSSVDETLLPLPLPYHVADPTISSPPQRLLRSDLPHSLARELDSYPDISGIANAARQISESLIAASRQRDRDDDPDDALIDDVIDEISDDDASLELDTGQIPRISALPPLAPAGDEDPMLLAVRRAPSAGSGDDDVTLPPARAIPRAGTIDDDQTVPRGLPRSRR